MTPVPRPPYATDERTSLLAFLEETARHAGHADLLREELDGATGYLPD